MAHLEVASKTQTSISIRMAGLQFPASSTNYQSIFIVNTTLNVSSSNLVDRAGNGGTSSPNYFTMAWQNTGLRVGTSYNYRADVRTATGGLYQFYLTDSTNPPNSPTLDYRVDSGAKINWNSVSGATSYTLRVRRGYDNYTQTHSATSTTTTITGYNYGVTHHLSVRAHGSGWTTAYSDESQLTFAPRACQLSNGTITENSAIVYATVTSGNWDYVAINLYEGASNFTTIIKTQNVNNGGNSWTNFTGLKNGTTYTVVARTWFSVNNTNIGSVNSIGNAGQTILSFTTSGGRPANWQWDINKVAGQKFAMTAVEWNNFTARINDFRRYKGLTQFTFTRANAGDIFKYNPHYSQASSAIQQLTNKWDHPVFSQWDGIYAKDLNLLRDRLNSVT